MISETLRVLLDYAKTSDLPLNWKTAKDVLVPLYHPNMSLVDVIHVILKAHEEARSESRFEVPRGQNAMEPLLLAPIKGFHAVELFGGTLDSRYTVEEFYDAMVKHMLSDLRFSKVGWLDKE